jgi:hypothetical protein
MFHSARQISYHTDDVQLSRAVPGHLAVLCSCPLRQLFLHQSATRQQLRDGLSSESDAKVPPEPVWYKRCFALKLPLIMSTGSA